MIWLILIGVLCLLFYYKAVRPLSYWKDRGVIHRKPWPLVGNSGQVILQKTSFFDLIHGLYQEFSNERYFGSHQFINRTLFINDLDLIKRITVKDFEYFIDRNNFMPEDVEPLLGKSLINLKGQRWRDMRAALSPSFTSSKMKMMFTLVSECAEEFTNHFENKEETFIEVEMKDVVSRFTNDAIATIAFGYKCNSLENKTNEFYITGKKAMNFTGLRLIAFFLYNIHPKIAKALHIPLFPKSVTEFFRHIIKDTLNKRENEGLVRPDMIHLLMEARKGRTIGDEVNVPDRDFAAVKESKILHPDRKHKIELSDEDITAQAFIFFFGGFETSSTLVSFTSYELALNTDIQKKLQNEIDETLNECNQNLTYEAINKMKYLDMVVSETLRKWPPGFVLDRLCVKDYPIAPVNAWEKPFVIEKGMVVQIPVIGIHRNPKYFPNPDMFDPERFNDENKHSIESFAYLPFGSGPRNCIASRFALMESKILISNLLSKFDITRTNKTPYPLRISSKSFNLGPAEGFWLGLRKRTFK